MNAGKIQNIFHNNSSLRPFFPLLFSSHPNTVFLFMKYCVHLIDVGRR